MNFVRRFADIQAIWKDKKLDIKLNTIRIRLNWDKLSFCTEFSLDLFWKQDSTRTKLQTVTSTVSSKRQMQIAKSCSIVKAETNTNLPITSDWKCLWKPLSRTKLRKMSTKWNWASQEKLAERKIKLDASFGTTPVASSSSSSSLHYYSVWLPHHTCRSPLAQKLSTALRKTDR